MNPSGHKASPFDLDDQQAYQAWRDSKLHHRPNSIDEYRLEIQDPHALKDKDIEGVRTLCRLANWALVRLARPPEDGEAAIRSLGTQLGLIRLDHNPCAEESGITALAQRNTERGYIPYTNRPLSWHTDGYYNPPHSRIRGMVLYCAQNAANGGSNAILDHELVYIHLRDRDPEFVKALMASDAMTIPANEENGRQLRPDTVGPVFSLDDEGNLHMRYTARKRNILWKNDTETRAAVSAIETLLSSPEAPIFHFRLAPGEAIVSNNVLHRREGFEDDETTGRVRLVYRARYYDRIAGTGLHDA